MGGKLSALVTFIPWIKFSSIKLSLSIVGCSTYSPLRLSAAVMCSLYIKRVGFIPKNGAVSVGKIMSVIFGSLSTVQLPVAGLDPRGEVSSIVGWNRLLRGLFWLEFCSFGLKGWNGTLGRNQIFLIYSVSLEVAMMWFTGRTTTNVLERTKTLTELSNSNAL